MGNADDDIMVFDPSEVMRRISDIHQANKSAKGTETSEEVETDENT
jgi:hypothetical protein